MDECAEVVGMLGVEPSKQLSRDGGCQRLVPKADGAKREVEQQSVGIVLVDATVHGHADLTVRTCPLPSEFGEYIKLYISYTSFILRMFIF